MVQKRGITTWDINKHPINIGIFSISTGMTNSSINSTAATKKNMLAQWWFAVPRKCQSWVIQWLIGEILVIGIYATNRSHQWIIISKKYCHGQCVMFLKNLGSIFQDCDLLVKFLQSLSITVTFPRIFRDGSTERNHLWWWKNISFKYVYNYSMCMQTFSCLHLWILSLHDLHLKLHLFATLILNNGSRQRGIL